MNQSKFSINQFKSTQMIQKFLKCSFKRFVEAIPCFDKLLEINPNNSKIFKNKINALLESSQYEKANQCFDKLIKIKPNYAEAFKLKGVALFKLQKYKEAIKFLDKSIEIDPNDS
jgi:tetratricopeptide (TPR) repeat protein